MEKQLIDTANSLFVDIDSCIQSCENDVKTTFIPMSSSEANMMLDKQNQIMGALKDEIVEEELSSKIAQLEAKRESLGESPEPENAVQSESIRKNLLWLYSLKRILTHTVGITDMQTDNGTVKVSFKNQSEH